MNNWQSSIQLGKEKNLSLKKSVTFVENVSGTKCTFTKQIYGGDLIRTAHTYLCQYTKMYIKHSDANV